MNLIQEFPNIDNNKIINNNTEPCDCVNINYENNYLLHQNCQTNIIYIRKNLKLYRITGPAIITLSAKTWCINDQYHRIKGPAIECSNGAKRYYKLNLKHRLNAPAFINVDYIEFYEYGKFKKSKNLA